MDDEGVVKLETVDFLQADEDHHDPKKRRASSSSGVAPPSCQAERCAADLESARKYHRRHKVCEFHAKAPVALVAGLHQRFCQQCSRFHELSEFDDAKRSCRRRLAGHNQRRRKSSSGDSTGESPPPSSSSVGSRRPPPPHHQMKETVQMYFH